MTGLVLDKTSRFRGRNLVGLRYSRLTVISYAGKNSRLDAYWECICDCGKTTVVTGHNLTRKNTKSCGCLHAEILKTPGKKFHWKHGFSPLRGKKPTYYVWATMIQRCTNPNSEKYRIYGARGITVCERWFDFKNFLADMGERPSPKHSIGRIENNGNYEPSNCRWETSKQQARNRRDNHFLEFNGKTATLVEWSEITGIEYNALKNRINNLGWPASRALTQPVKRLCRS